MSSGKESSSHPVDIQETGEGGSGQSFKNLFDSINIAKNTYIFSPIYKVPSRLREVNPNSFIPRVVSIGPLHKGRASLKSMENKKATEMTKLMEYVGSPTETFEKCMQKVMGSIGTIKGLYFGKEIEFTDIELAQMMVIDGCFILKFILDIISKNRNDYSYNKLRSRNIALDLVLLENQIPFFVLQALYDLTVKKKQPGSSLTTMLKVLLDRVNPFDEPLKERNEPLSGENMPLKDGNEPLKDGNEPLNNENEPLKDGNEPLNGENEPLKDGNVGKETTDPFHILGLLHKFYEPNFNLSSIEEFPAVHSAVELDKIGVRIRPNKNLTWPMAMEFVSSHKPTLIMPVVRVDNFFEVVLRNLIAYEQYSPVKNCVTSYAMAMDMLVATPTDIAKLGKSGVIISHLANEKASDMISSICINVNLQDFYYMEPWKNIGQYYDSYWTRNFGVFKRTYIDTPWKAIALTAAIIVFLITVIQFFRQVVLTPFL